jgi:hypothetical protein
VRRLARRSATLAAVAGHVEDEALHGDLGARLTDYGLGPAHGVDGGRRRHRAVGLGEHTERLPRDQLWVAGTDADPEQAAWGCIRRHLLSPETLILVAAGLLAPGSRLTPDGLAPRSQRMKLAPVSHRLTALGDGRRS